LRRVGASEGGAGSEVRRTEGMAGSDGRDGSEGVAGATVRVVGASGSVGPSGSVGSSDEEVAVGRGSGKVAVALSWSKWGG
jgi:hypothetical protein